VHAPLCDRQSRLRAEAGALVLGSDQIPASGEVKWRADPKGAPHPPGRTGGRAVAAGSAGVAGRVPIRERDRVSSGLLLRSDRRLPARADCANYIRAIDLRSVFGGASVARSSPLVSCSGSAPGRSRCPNAGWMRSETAALGTPAELARCEGPLELTADMGLAELRLKHLRPRWRYSRLARTAFPRSRRKCTSRSPSCGRCSCARQQST
jgi:hypothetical protein